MDKLRQTTWQIFKSVWFVAFFAQMLVGGVLIVLIAGDVLEITQAALLSIVAWAAVAWLVATQAQRSARIPLDAVGRAILHVSPSEHGVAAPKLESLRIGRAYVTDLMRQIQELANVQVDQEITKHHAAATQSSNILSHMPLPLFAFNKDQLVTFASDTALEYTASESAQLFGKPLFAAVDLEFSSDFTLESWIADCQSNKATDTAYWERVRIRSKTTPDVEHQCDIAGSYSRDNSEGIEFVITMFDHTKAYLQDDQSINFVALAVHELRTPLTIMRGYIEAFSDEQADKLGPSTAQYLQRIEASAKQLSGFVNNILNVARIQENQLGIKLAEESWPTIVNHACQDMSVQAIARGKVITQHIDPSLPTVGVDRTTMYEVLCNLLDNAIKYSANSKEIVVSAKLTKDGLIETSVQDNGVGIPASVLPTLFEKFHRNHRNRLQIGGTGLGLYISKAIIDAHDGNIWVNSIEGKGSTFSFTVQPFQSLAGNLKTGDNDSMTRTAHGWIKNHSLYRK